MASFAAIELVQGAAPPVLIVDVGQDIQRLVDAPELREGLSQAGGPVADLHHAHDIGSRNAPELEGSREAQKIVPVRRNEREIDFVSGHIVEFTVVGMRVDPPQARAADVGQPWAKAISQEAKEAEDNIAVSAGIGHDLGWLEIRFLLEYGGEQDDAVAQGSRNRNGVQSGELIGDEVVPSDAPAMSKIFGIGSGVNRLYRHDETHPVGGSNFTTDPGARQRNPALC